MANAYLNSRRMSILSAALCGLACALISAGAWAQDVSTTTTMKGPSTYETAVRSGTVVYVSGNELVVKLSDGVVEHFVVSPTQTFTVDGKQVTVSQLTPGTHLTQTITTKTTPKTITTVRTIQGKVWHVNAPSTVILTLPEGENKQYNVPKGQTFNIGGQQETVFQLRKGMNVSATVVTEEPVVTSSTSKSVTGVAPKPKAQVPETVDVLLVESPTPAPQPTQTAAAEPAPQALPKTGSEWPLVGLLGLGSLGAGMVTRRLRLAWK